MIGELDPENLLYFILNLYFNFLKSLNYSIEYFRAFINLQSENAVNK